MNILVCSCGALTCLFNFFVLVAYTFYIDAHYGTFLLHDSYYTLLYKSFLLIKITNLENVVIVKPFYTKFCNISSVQKTWP